MLWLYIRDAFPFVNHGCNLFNSLPLVGLNNTYFLELPGMMQKSHSPTRLVEISRDILSKLVTRAPDFQRFAAAKRGRAAQSKWKNGADAAVIILLQAFL